jgi:hypothetical protein
MSLAIHKYFLNHVAGVSDVAMPKGAKVIHCGVQRGDFQLWAIVDLDEKQTERRHFVIIGTGQKFDASDLERMKHLVTFQQDIFVWHVFEWL